MSKKLLTSNLKPQTFNPQQEFISAEEKGEFQGIFNPDGTNLLYLCFPSKKSEWTF